MKTCWLGDWAENGSVATLDEEFDTKTGLTEDQVLLAYYSYKDYSGTAFVLFRRGGTLYEVNAGHCSCNGLEGQWAPEETTAEVLRHRMTEGDLGTEWSYPDRVDTFRNDLTTVLDELEKTNT